MTRTFDSTTLIEMDVPYGGECVISDTITGHSRWSVQHEVIFREPGDGPNEAWMTWYSVGATEMQDESPWEYEKEVECVRVVRRTVTEFRWVEEDTTSNT